MWHMLCKYVPTYYPALNFINWFRAAEINEEGNDQSDIPEIPFLKAKCMAETLRQVMRLFQISS